ncbi:MAG: YebC/PmpR family DNA-binding transcriptional regulator [Clostridiales bacterium]|jgi:YebC/PmpR family DNA-binding regulatory protein|nr:YebC/PmpR family DNA-binding transcriptional regulator [Clostridiales bacterium]
MSGHSKWSTIKRQKGKTDAARAKIFTKIGREVAVAIKMGGVDTQTNSRLRDCIAKARAANMPNENITRFIKKASGELDSINYEHVLYEGYGVCGSAVIVEALTDNKNRTAGEVRHIFDKYGGALGANGCVQYLFEKKGVMIVDKTIINQTEDEFVLLCLDYAVEDVLVEQDEYIIYTSAIEFGQTHKSLLEKGIVFLSAQVDRVPKDKVQLDADSLNKFENMLDKFEESEDIQEVYHNVK